MPLFKGLNNIAQAKACSILNGGAFMTQRRMRAKAADAPEMQSGRERETALAGSWAGLSACLVKIG